MIRSNFFTSLRSLPRGLFALPVLFFLAAEVDGQIGKKVHALSLGKEVPDGELEAVCLVMRMDEAAKRKELGWAGTGFLIDPQTVVSAAHVAFGQRRVVLGFPNVRPVDDPTTTRNESLSRQAIFIGGTRYEHPGFRNGTTWPQGGDLAVIRLDQPVSEKTVGVTPLALSASVPRADDILTLVGFGLKGKYCGEPPAGKRRMDLRLERVSGGFLRFHREGAHSCPGDSGGPALNAAGEVVGLCSSGNSSESSFYTEVHPYLKWLHSYVGRETAWIAPSDGRSFTSQRARAVLNTPTLGWTTWLVGDFNGDGFADVLRHVRYHLNTRPQSELWVASNNGSGGFYPLKSWMTGFGFERDLLEVGDVNGDGKADIVSFVQEDSVGHGKHRGWVFVALSTGKSFTFAGRWHNNFSSYYGEVPRVGDFNGDGKADIVTFLRGDSRNRGERRGNVYVALSDGREFQGAQRWHLDFANSDAQIPHVGDFNGDGKTDVVAFLRDDRAGSGKHRGWVYVALSDGRRFGALNRWHGNFCINNSEIPRVGDVNGDGKDDIVTFLQQDTARGGEQRGWVYVATSNGSQFQAASRWHNYFSVLGSEVPLLGQFHKSHGSDRTIDAVTIVHSTK